MEQYKQLVGAGLNGVVCFQETYHREAYKKYHPRGMKSHYAWRLNGFDRMGQAGVHKIGMGVLIGLEDWRTDLTMLARHLLRAVLESMSCQMRMQDAATCTHGPGRNIPSPPTASGERGSR